MSIQLTLSGWIGLVMGSLRPTFDFIEESLEMPKDEKRQTKAHLITRPDLPFSLVLGTRRKEEGEGHEAFFEVCSPTKGSMGNVVARITHVIILGERTWTCEAEPSFTAATLLPHKATTNDVGQSVWWVDAIMEVIKAQAAATIKAQAATPPP